MDSGTGITGGGSIVFIGCGAAFILIGLALQSPEVQNEMLQNCGMPDILSSTGPSVTLTTVLNRYARSVRPWCVRVCVCVCVTLTTVLNRFASSACDACTSSASTR